MAQVVVVAVGHVGGIQGDVGQVRVTLPIQLLVEQPVRRAGAEPAAAVEVEAGGAGPAAERGGGIGIGAQVPGLVEEAVRRVAKLPSGLEVVAEDRFRVGVAHVLPDGRVGVQVPVGAELGPGRKLMLCLLLRK